MMRVLIEEDLMLMVKAAIVQPITFFRTEEAAREVYDKGGMTEAEGYRVVRSTSRCGWFVIECTDPETGDLLGYI